MSFSPFFWEFRFIFTQKKKTETKSAIISITFVMKNGDKNLAQRESSKRTLVNNSKKKKWLRHANTKKRHFADKFISDLAVFVMLFSQDSKDKENHGNILTKSSPP